MQVTKSCPCCWKGSSSSGSASGSSGGGCCDGLTLPDRLRLTLTVTAGPADCACLEFSGLLMSKVADRKYDSDATSECGVGNTYELDCHTDFSGVRQWRFHALTSACVEQVTYWDLADVSCEPFQLTFMKATYVMDPAATGNPCTPCGSHKAENVTLQAVIVEDL